MSSAALDLLHALVLEDGRRWGEAAERFQVKDARAVLDPHGPPFHFLTRSRGSSKTSDLAAITTALILTELPSRSRSYGFASDRDQAALLVDAIGGFVHRTPEIQGSLKVENFMVTATRTGSTFTANAADAPGSWGLRPNLIVIDELPMWPTTPGARQLFEAVTSAAAKVEGARMILLGTAGSPGHWSKKILEHAKGDRLWRVHEQRGPAPWMSKERLAEQKRRLPESVYLRLFENKWVEGEDRLARESDLKAAASLDGPLAWERGHRYVLGLDIGVKNDRTVATVAHGEPVDLTPVGQVEPTQIATRVVLDRVGVWTPTRTRHVTLAEVEEWVAEAAHQYHVDRVVLDPWQALQLAQSLRRRGIRVEEFSFNAGSVSRLATTLLLLLREQRLAIPRDNDLLDELRNVRLRETGPNQYRIDHDPDGHDDRVISLGMAAHAIVSGRSVAPASLNATRVGFVDGPSLAADGAPHWSHSGRVSSATPRYGEGT